MRSMIVVRNAKGAKDRMARASPEALHAALRDDLAKVHALFEEERRGASVSRACISQRAREEGSERPERMPVGDPRSGKTRWHHAHENGLRRR